MRNWPFSALEHVAFNDLLLLPFLAPQFLKDWPVRSTLPSLRRSTCYEPPSRSNKNKARSRHRYGDATVPAQAIVGGLCQFAAARTTVPNQRRCCLHSIAVRNQDSRHVGAISTKASSNITNDSKAVGRRSHNYTPPQPTSPKTRGRSNSALFRLDDVENESQHRGKPNAALSLDDYELWDLVEVASDRELEPNNNISERFPSDPIRRSTEFTNLKKIRFLGELSSRHPLKTSFKSLKQKNSSTDSLVAPGTQQPTLGAFSRTWTETVASINALHDPKFPHYLRQKYKLDFLPVSRESQAHLKTAKDFVRSHPSISQADHKIVKSHWDGIPPDEQGDIWPLVVLQYLSKAPRSALEFVRAINLNPVPPFYQLEDLLDINAMYLLRNADADHYASMFEVTQLALQIYPTLLSNSQRAIRTLLKHRNLLPIDARSVYEMMETHKVERSHNTNLHFAYALAAEQEHTLASTVFFEAVRNGADVKTSQVKLTAAKLLRELPSQDGYGAATNLVADFLSIEMELTVAMYNILMIKAFDSGDPATAWKIYDLFRSYGMRADDHTYSIMLRGSRLTNDAPRCEEVMGEVESLANHTPNDTLLAEILRNLYFFRNKTLSCEEKFSQVLQFYARYYDMQLLQRLGVVDRATTEHFKTIQTRRPTSWIVGIMLFAFLRTGKTSHCVNVYRNFRDIVEKHRDPTMIELSAQPFIYDIFLKRICDIDSTLWQEVLADMSTELPNTINPETCKQFVPPKPTTQTMNIILHGYAKRGDSEAVKRLFNLMGESGLKPDVITYTSIVDAHARKQDVRLVAESLKHMEDQAVAANRFTLWSINRINDRSGLVEALRKLQYERQTDHQPSQELAYAHANSDDVVHSL